MDFSKLTEAEIVEAICFTAKSLKSNHKRKNKLIETEITSGLVSRARGTTLVANSWKATKSYNTDIEYLKKLINKLL